MNGTITWILVGFLSTVGIVLYFMSGTGGVEGDLDTQTQLLRKAAQEELHSEDSVAEIRGEYASVEGSFAARRDGLNGGSGADITSTFNEVLKQNAPEKRETEKFATSLWGALRESFENRISKIKKETKRPPTWNYLGHAWNEEAQKYDFEEPGAPSPWIDSGIEQLDDLITSGTSSTGGWSEANADGEHFGHMASIVLDRVLSSVENRLASDLKGKIFHFTNFDFSMLSDNIAKETYGSNDPFMRWNMEISVMIEPSAEKVFLSSLASDLAAASAPRMRIIGLSSKQAQAPEGVAFRLTPEEAKEKLGVEVPDTAKEFETWVSEEYPKIHAIALEKGLGDITLPTELTITLELSVLDADSELLAVEESSK